MKRAKLVGVFFSVLVLIVSTTGLVAADGIPGSGWWSGSNVQNVGGGTTSVTITAYDSASTSTYTHSVDVDAGASYNFTPYTFTELPTGFIGSAIVSAAEPIKSMTNVTNQLSGSLGVSGGKAAAQYQGTESPDTTLYFPLAKSNRYGKTTAYYLMNAGGSAATIDVSFKMDNGSTYPYTSPSVGPGQMVVVIPADAGVPTTPSDGTRVNIGSMTATSTTDLAGTMMEYIEAETIATVLNGSRGLTASDFATKAYAPITKNNRYNRFTGIQIMNVTGGLITATVTYIGSANVAGCKDVTFVDTVADIPAGSSKTINQQTPASNLIANCTAAATITATGNFVAVVNETNTAAGTPAGITFAAIPDPSSTTELSAPQFKDQRYGFSTGLQIQNVGTVDATNVVATFNCKGNGSSNTPFIAITNPLTITAGSAINFYKPSTTQQDRFTVANPFNISNAICGVIVTADQSIVAVANETPDSAGALDDNNYEGFNLVP